MPMEERMESAINDEHEEDRRTSELVNDEAAWKGFVLMGSVASHEFRFEEHGLTERAHALVEEAIVDGLVEQGLFANCNTIGIIPEMCSLAVARDYLISQTLLQPPESGFVRRFIRRSLLQLYRLAGQGLRRDGQWI